MKIKSIRNVGKQFVYDIHVEDNNQYILENGIISHNSGPEYACNDSWVIKREQLKDGAEVAGYKFKIVAVKSRSIKEKSELPINVYWQDGIHKYSGLSDLALEFGIISKIKMEGIKGKPTGLKFKDYEVQEKLEDTDDDFWTKVLAESDLAGKIHEKFKS